jgi:hypothetical protein
MPLLARNIAVSIYRVEVSGWHKQQAFFVEKSELHWSAPSGKHIARLRPKSRAALHQCSGGWRHRHGKGTGGPRHPSDQPGQFAKTGSVQLLCAGGYPARKPTVRVRARRVYRSNGRAARTVRIRQWRRRFSRRGRRNLAAHAGQAAAGLPRIARSSASVLPR